MCQTDLISRSIESLSKRSFNRRIKVVSPMHICRNGEVTKLCNSLDNLCKMLHDNFPTITEKDYNIFGPELRLLIMTLKDLHADSVNNPNIQSANSVLLDKIADLEEIEHDIVNFRVQLQNNNNFKSLMTKISSFDFSKLKSRV